MAGKKVVQCVGPSYYLADRKAAVQRAVNCYPQKLDDNRWMMDATPGEVQVASLAAPIRGSRNVEGRWFVVASHTLYEMTYSGALPPVFTAVARGTLLTLTGFVGMAHNATQVGIVDGPYYYVYDLIANTLTQITVAGWRGSYDIHELDGYFVMAAPNTDQFYISGLDDGTTLDPLDFSSADSLPDVIITHRVTHRQLWLLGSTSGEIWVDSGEAAFPFVRYRSYTLEIGVVGARAAINAADTLFWIGQSRNGRGIVYMASGNQPQRVSNLAVEEALRGSTDLSLAEMWTYQVQGHEFVGINAPGLTSTWVFDAADQQWHERAEWSAGWAALRSRLYTALNGEHYGGDIYGSVVRLDTSKNTLAGRVLRRERTWPHFAQDSMEPTSYRGLEVAMKSGADGNVALELSNDGGITYGPPLVKSLGVTGRWMQRVRWLGLGTAINRVFRLWVADDVPFGLHAAAVDA